MHHGGLLAAPRRPHGYAGGHMDALQRPRGCSFCAAIPWLSTPDRPGAQPEPWSGYKAKAALIRGRGALRHATWTGRVHMGRSNDDLDDAELESQMSAHAAALMRQISTASRRSECAWWHMHAWDVCTCTTTCVACGHTFP
eukprot:159820-Chlamydomonas_euryale.AAC.9